MNDFLAFRKMVTPVLIQVLFWLGTVSLIVGSVAVMNRGNLLEGLIVLVGGVLWLRVGCEIVIILFKMHECLEDIRRDRAGGADDQPQSS